MIKQKFELLCQNQDKTTSSRDICEHLPILAKYASKCNHITEFGVRSVVSTYGFLYGLPKGGKMISYDIERHPNIKECMKTTIQLGIDRDFIQGDTRSITIEQTDLLFIDTLHNYDLLIQELNRHASKVNKYIMFHDTETYGYRGETEGHEGLVKAIKEFQSNNPERKTKYIYRNNNGLTVLERVEIPVEINIKKEVVLPDNNIEKIVADVVVYTAIYGDIDVLKKQPEQIINIRWVCFTDNHNIEFEKGAEKQREVIVTQPHKHLHPRMQAKYFRTHPDKYFDAKTVIWMDGSGRLLKENSIEHFMSQMLDKSDIVCFQHPERNCIMAEAQFCTSGGTQYTIGKYKGLPMKDQVDRYFKEGYPKNYGLTGTGLLITKSSNKKIIDFLHKRWTECLERTYQDQLSFDYLVWREKIKRQRLKENERDNDYVTFIEKHKHGG